MRPFKIIASSLLLLPIAEIAAFIAVANLIGIATALVLLVALSVTGVFLLRSLSVGAVSRLRRAAGGLDVDRLDLDGSGIAAAIGAILLVVPGFITGILGALVIFPATRKTLTAAFRHLLLSGRKAPRSRIVDLEPGEWQPVPTHELPPRTGS